VEKHRSDRLRFSRKRLRRRPDATTSARAHDAEMVDPVSYAVTWAEGESRFVGHALLAGRGLRLEGRDASAREGRRSIRFDQILSLETRRTNGHRSLLIEIAGDDRVVITSLDRPGSLGELAERLRVLTDSPQG
jgi:hypothetical protein